MTDDAFFISVKIGDKNARQMFSGVNQLTSIRHFWHGGNGKYTI